MFRQLKKNLVATLIAAMTIGQVAPAFADSADTLPDMGTSAGSTLSIGQEMQMGDYYVRQLRGSAIKFIFTCLLHPLRFLWRQ